jgi:hypothetical protein
MAYTWLHENPEGEAGKGVLTVGVVLWWRVRGRRSGRGSRRSGRGGAPWRRETHGGVGEQPEEAAGGGVLRGELSLPSFLRRRRRLVLNVGGAH